MRASRLLVSRMFHIQFGSWQRGVLLDRLPREVISLGEGAVDKAYAPQTAGETGNLARG
ncbi:hypothetical protein SBBP2_1480020 [Burkholderiales bacterium]|nr:hypothetical protein SBBP2_1480020 [Burkholderiales bacterium]